MYINDLENILVENNSLLKDLVGYRTCAYAVYEILSWWYAKVSTQNDFVICELGRLDMYSYAIINVNV